MLNTLLACDLEIGVGFCCGVELGGDFLGVEFSIEVGEEFFELRLFALGAEFDAAVGEIADEAGQFEAVGE